MFEISKHSIRLGSLSRCSSFWSSIKTPDAKFIEKRGEGIHHIAFEVDDINEEMNRVKEKNFQLVDSAPRHGANNSLIAFIHPKSVNGVLVELTQEKKGNKNEQ